MLLVLTSVGDVTSDYLVKKLSDGGIPFIRLDTDHIVDQLIFEYLPGLPRFQLDGRWYTPQDFSNVWYRRPERLKSKTIPDSPEGVCILDEWSEALEAFFAHIPRERWMNHPAANAVASRKLEQLTKARELGLTIPDTVVTQDSKILTAFFEKHNGTVVVKPLGKASVERAGDGFDTIIHANRVNDQDLEGLSSLSACPTFFQSEVRKVSDVRITIVDEHFHAIEMVAIDGDGRQRCDIRRNNMKDVSYRTIALPRAVERMLRDLMKHYNLRFSAIDMAVDQDGNWHFFEINPNGQWAWLDLVGEASIYESFAMSFSCT